MLQLHMVSPLYLHNINLNLYISPCLNLIRYVSRPLHHGHFLHSELSRLSLYPIAGPSSRTQRQYRLTDGGLCGLQDDGPAPLPGLERHLDDRRALVQQQEAAVVTRRRRAAAA